MTDKPRTRERLTAEAQNACVVHETSGCNGAAADHATPMLISVVIPNYNYGDFIADAIDSALNLDWPRVEVIVVDDGSTDDSADIIRGYGERITSLFQSNAGQRVACNAGFERASGEVVIFLDSDDTLSPSLVRELAMVWHPGVSKVQFQMQVVDAAGKGTGSVLPQYTIVPQPEEIRRWVLTTGTYPTPPGSGNAYARAFLARIFPLLGRDPSCDAYCVAAAPFLGDVVTVAKPLVSYRVHGRNDGAMSQLASDRFGRDLARACWRFEYAQTIARTVGLDLPSAALHKSLQLLPYRLASLCLLPERHPIERDSTLRVLVDLARAVFIPQGVGLTARLAIAVWGGLVAIAPKRVRTRLVLWRFASASRPELLRRALKALSVVQR